MPGSVTATAESIRTSAGLRARRHVTNILVACGALGLGACREPTVCHNAIRPPLTIEVRDAMTGAPAARGAEGTIRSGTYVAALGTANPATDLVLTAPGGPGEYTVTIQKAGYRDWKRSNIRAGNDGCGQPRTVFLKADLVSRPNSSLH